MNRHTKRDLVDILKERGLRANRLLGQNFLIDHNVLEYICGAADLSKDDAVLEIGAGTGMLTWHIAQNAGAVLAVEIDKPLAEIAADYLKDFPNVKVINSDIHGKRRTINDAVMQALDEIIPRKKLKIVSNLPYCISSDLILSLLESKYKIERMVLTVQKEFADRLSAFPGTRDYSSLTMILKAQAKIERLRSLPPDVFWPVPAIGSAIIRVTPDPAMAENIKDYKTLKAVAAALFTQRRKTAAAALGIMTHPKLDKRLVFAVLEIAGVDGAARADGIEPDKAVAIANAIASKQLLAPTRKS